MSRNVTRALLGLSAAATALAFGAPASAQEVMSAQEVEALPAEYRTGPVREELTETITNADGVETITRTRRIESTMPVSGSHGSYPEVGYGPAYMPRTVVDREAWIEECEARTEGYGEEGKGRLIGGLLGALGGGFLGNRIAGDGRRLGGTLIGAGAGGLGGYLIGDAIDGGKKEGRYDCAAALDSYLSHYSAGGPRFASRTIPAPMPAYGYPAYAPSYYSYSYAPAYSYTYAPPQQIVYVPIQYEQQQRVIVRETVREETYEVPGATRYIERPAPSPKMIKQPTRVPAPAPRPVKMIKE